MKSSPVEGATFTGEKRGFGFTIFPVEMRDGESFFRQIQK